MDRLAGIYLFFSRLAVDGAQHLLLPLSLPLSLSIGGTFCAIATIRAGKVNMYSLSFCSENMG